MFKAFPDVVFGKIPPVFDNVFLQIGIAWDRAVVANQQRNDIVVRDKLVREINNVGAAETISGDGFGYADETLSARAWRLPHQSSFPYKVINALFFWQENHCKEAYYSEVFNKQLPREYTDAINK